MPGIQDDTPPVLLVTGGSRGIGAEIVRGAARRGWAVAFSYVQDREAARCLQDEVRAAGGTAVGLQGDVADPQAVAALFADAEDALGPLAGLVNNAGVTGCLGAFVDIDLATIRRVLDVNVLGTMLCAQEAVRRWRDRAMPGVMVNISSVASTLGAPGEYVHYAASKAAVEAFTIGLAKELAAGGTRVNAVAPGTAHTGIHAAAGEPGRPARVAARIPMGRAGEPSEIAEAVLWMLSPQASYVTGAVLRVSGGL